MPRFQYISGKRRVFVKLRQKGEISRAELARQCGLTRPAVSAIVEELIADGYVRETGVGRSTGGKPPIMLEFCPRSRCAIGIDLGRDGKIEGVLCDLAGNVIASEQLPCENDFEFILNSCVKVVKALIAACKEEICDMLPSGIGVSVSAIVDAEQNEALDSSTLDVSNRSFSRRLESLTALPVKIERRPNAAALAEALSGAGENYRQLLYITSGRGVGAGIVIDGEIFRGVHGFSGEIGELLLPGVSGSLQSGARPSAMLSAYENECGKKVSMDEFLKLFFEDDKTAVALVLHNARQLAYAAAVAANMFDPDVVVLGGEVLDFGEIHFEEFKKHFNILSQSCRLGRGAVVQRSKFGRRGVAVGGAQLILDELII